jgi:hypothetical protein
VASGKTAILAIRIIADASAAAAGFDDLDKRTSSSERTMNRLSAGAGIALAGITAAAGVAGQAASDLQQSTGGIDAVFGKYAGKVHDYAQSAATALGLSENEYNEFATVIGSQMKNAGVAQDQLGGKTNDLLKQAADLAATFGGPTSDAVEALSSAMKGEMDPIEKYGISLNQTMLQQQAAAMGIDGSSASWDNATKQQVILAAITKQSADAQGQFAAQTNTAAEQQQIANAQWENASAALGQSLLPAMTEGARIAGSLAGWMQQNTEVVTILVGGIGTLSAAILIINAGMKVFAAVQAIQTAAQWANNAAWLASPITWIVLAIVAAIAAVIAITVLLITHWSDVQRIAGQVWSNVIAWAGRVAQPFVDAFHAIASWWGDLVGSWQRGFDSLIGWIRTALNWLGKIANKAVPGWVQDLTGIHLNSFVATGFDAASAQAATATPSMLAAPMMFAAPMALSVPTISDAPANSTAAAGAGTTTNYTLNLTVNGAVDKEATGRQIIDLIDEYLRNNGRIPAAGFSAVIG